MRELFFKYKVQVNPLVITMPQGPQQYLFHMNPRSSYDSILRHHYRIYSLCPSIFWPFHVITLMDMIMLYYETISRRKLQYYDTIKVELSRAQLGAIITARIVYTAANDLRYWYYFFSLFAINSPARKWNCRTRHHN